MNKTKSRYLKKYTFLFACLLIGVNEFVAQVSLTIPQLTVTACPSFPTPAGTMGDIVIAETQPNDITGSGTITFSCPSTFWFTNPGTLSGNTSDVNGFSVSYTNNSVTITFNVSDSTQLDTIILSGVQMVGILNPTSMSNIINAGGTAVIKGDTVGMVHAKVTSTGMPVLISSLNPPAFCSGTAFNYTPISSVDSSTFNWTRATAVGLSDTANAGVGNPMEVLTDTTTSAVNATYIYTVAANGCTNPSTYSVVATVNPVPSLISNHFPFAICTGTLFTYDPQSSIDSTSYLWSRMVITGISDTATVGNDSIREVLHDTASTVVSVVYTFTLTAHGCSNTIPDSVFLPVNPAPKMTSNTSASVCNNDTLLLALSSDIAATYQWMASDNIHTMGESLFLQITDTIIDVLSSDTSSLQTVGYTIVPTSLLSCVGDTQMLVVGVIPTPVVTNNDTITICSGSSISTVLTSNVTSSFSWSAADNSNTTGESLTLITNDTLTDTIVNLTGTDQMVIYSINPVSLQSNCMGLSKNIVVVVKPLPAITSVSSDTICSGTELSVVLASDMPSTYEWMAMDNILTYGESLQAQTSDTLSNVVVNLTDTIQTVSYSIIPTSIATGCQGVAQTFNLTVNPAPAVNAGNNLTLCSGNSDTLGTAMVNGYTYLWEPGIGLSDSTVSNPLSVATNSTDSVLVNSYSLSVTEITTGCIAYDTAIVRINPQPVLNINNPAAICFPGIVDLTDSAITLGSTGGGVFTYWNDSLTADTLLMPNAVAISDTVFIKVTAIGGCSDIDSVVTIVKPAPIINAGSDKSFCSGFYDTLGINSDTSYTYLWSPGAGLNDSTVAMPITTGVNVGALPMVTNYILTATLSSTGCSTKDTVVVTINPQPTLIVTNPPMSCSLDTVDLTDSAITIGSTTGTYSYWIDSTITDTLQHPEQVFDAGTYYIRLAAAGGCADTQAIAVVVNPLPLVYFTGLNYSSCYNSGPQVLTGFPEGGVFSGIGVVGDTFIAANAGVGTQPVMYTYTDTNGCSRTASQFVDIIPLSNITPQLCMVTVDTGSMHNIIYWNRASYTNVDSFIIYREIMPDSFAPIGAVPRTSNGIYTDTTVAIYAPNTGNPNVADYKYKLQVRDTCGTYSVLSAYHNSIYLTHSGGVFSLTHYQIENELIPIPEISTYVLARDSHSNGTWDVVASCPSSQFTITDPNYLSYTHARWRVETLWSISCGNVTKSISNMIVRNTVGVEENSMFSWPVTIYPNPYSQSTTVQYSLNKEEVVTVEAFNALGQRVETFVNNANQPAGDYQYQFSAKKQGYSAGVYFIKITVDGKTLMKRVIETE